MECLVSLTGLLWLVLTGTAVADLPLKVVTTLPTLASLVREVGGDSVVVTSLSKGDQDPHFVSPTPVLMKKTREADLFIELGLSFDRWADDVVNGSGNPKLFRGQPGRIVASVGIPVLDIPPVLSRALGDTHPNGNPHFWLDPLRVKLLVANIEKALVPLRPEAAATFSENSRRFERRIDEALFGKELVELVGSAKLVRLAWSGRLNDYLDSTMIDGEPLRTRLGGWLRKGERLRGTVAVEYHKVWIYFARLFGIELAGQIEERPGIPPGPQHQRRTIDLLRSRGIPLILVDNYYDPKLPRFIAAEAGATAVVLPNQVGGEPGINDYFDLIQHILDQLLGSLPAVSVME